MVSKNSGNEEDARDTLQEAILLTYKKIRNGSLELTTTFASYFFTVCWHIWMRELRNRQIEMNNLMEYYYLEQEADKQLTKEYEQQRKYRLYQEHFQRLGDECKKLLKLFLKKYPLKDIARIMGHKSEKAAKKKKYICKERLVRSIKNDKRFRDYHGRK
jgi:DNA-directed RNA polymerase specialized sigma24 family protein